MSTPENTTTSSAAPGSGAESGAGADVAPPPRSAPEDPKGDAPAPELDEAATRELLEEVAAIEADDEVSLFVRRQRLARLLGAHHDPDTGLTRFGFWAPEISEARIEAHAVALELFTPLERIDFDADRVAGNFHRTRVSLEPVGDWWWAVVANVRAGTKERAGAMYRLRAQTGDGTELFRRDLVAYSLPWGAFAPAEVYDIESMQRERRDLEHFARTPEPPATILELHVPTATAGGTIRDLAAVYRKLGEKLRAGGELTPAEAVYAGYEAIQPLPVDPTIERPAEVDTFTITDTVDELAGIVGVLLRRPDNINWGYDNVVLASSATNPSLLATRRPHELVELAEALHAMPEPMMLIFDLVYGHADNQAIDLLPNRFVSGPNMYGLDLNHQDPSVRAILLEMQRRRMNAGCDGLRIDGAQDFKYYNPMTGEVEHDDSYLQSMSDVVQEIGEHARRPWMIFEDGRPWPREDWPTASTYRDVIEKQPDVWQWGPLIFAHNTPMLEGFWREKFWRVEQIRDIGGHWISGCANHDTVRRGTQIELDQPLNHHLGDTLPEILDAAYDNPAIAAISCALLPGIPMDFVNATTRTPWGFMRTTDDVYGPKVMAEERGFLDWQVNEAIWARPDAFRRTRRHGFDTLEELKGCLARLQELIERTDYDLDEIAVRLDGPSAMLGGPAGLHLLAADFMGDMHALCNVGPRLDELDPKHCAYMLALRNLRIAERWTMADCREGDLVEMLDGEQTVYRGHRVAPDGARAPGTRVATIANMAGPAFEASLGETLTLDLDPERSRVLLSPGARLEGDRLTLPDGQAITLVADPR